MAAIDRIDWINRRVIRGFAAICRRFSDRVALRASSTCLAHISTLPEEAREPSESFRVSASLKMKKKMKRMKVK